MQSKMTNHPTWQFHMISAVHTNENKRNLLYFPHYSISPIMRHVLSSPECLHAVLVSADGTGPRGCGGIKIVLSDIREEDKRKSVVSWTDQVTSICNIDTYSEYANKIAFRISLSCCQTCKISIPKACDCLIPRSWAWPEIRSSDAQSGTRYLC